MTTVVLGSRLKWSLRNKTAFGKLLNLNRYSYEII